MATYKYIISKNKKKNGKYAIYLRLTHNRVPTTMATGLDVYSEEWQEETGRVKKIKNGSNNIARINSKLNKKQLKVEAVIDKLEDSEELNNLSVTELRNIICGKEETVSVFTFWSDLINKNKQFSKVKTKRAYQNTLKSVKKFRKNIDLNFNEFTYSLLNKYEQWYLLNDGSINGLATYLRILKAVVNEAIKSGVLSTDESPFRFYKIKKEDPTKRSLTYDEFQTLKNTDLGELKNLENYKAIFLISFYMGGIPFVDLARLKIENIVNDEIHYKRSKTGILVKIPIIPELKKLLGAFITNRSNGYIFDFIKNDNSFVNEKNYNNQLNKYNTSLREIGKICKFKITLSSYVARHTFATLALTHFKFPLSFVQKSLGHKSISTTQIYVNEYDKEKRTEIFKNLK